MSMTRPASDEQKVVTASIVAIALLGIAGSVIAGVFLSLRAGLSVAMGASAAAANLWLLSFLIRHWFQPGASPAPWALITLFKFGGLIALLYVLVASGLAQAVPLILGFGTLPLGIVAGQLGVSRAAREGG